jgi:hypothetical protein
VHALAARLRRTLGSKSLLPALAIKGGAALKATLLESPETIAAHYRTVCRPPVLAAGIIPLLPRHFSIIAPVSVDVAHNAGKPAIQERSRRAWLILQ